MSIIDGEIKKLLYTLLFAGVFLIGLLWVGSNFNSFSQFLTRTANNVTGQKNFEQEYTFNLNNSKTYYIEIDTDQGKMTFLLYKDNAPNTVNNIVNLIKDDFYKDSTYIEKKDDFVLLGKGGKKTNVDYKLKEEINAKSLGLDTINVSQYYTSLLKAYDKNTLDANMSKSVEDFYTSLGYRYINDIFSKPITKGALVMYSETPGNFGNLFFISTNGPIPHIEGRMTVFGIITSGQDVLDKIAKSSSTDIKLRSITIIEK